MSVTPPKKWRCLTCFLQPGLLLRTARRQQGHRQVRLVGFCATMLQMTCPQLKDITDILLLFYSVKLLIYGFLSQSVLANAVPHGLGIIVKFLWQKIDRNYYELEIFSWCYQAYFRPIIMSVNSFCVGDTVTGMQNTTFPFEESLNGI